MNQKNRIVIAVVVLLEGSVVWDYTVKGRTAWLFTVMDMNFHQAILFAFVIVIAISAFTTAVPMYLGVRNVNRLEF